VWRVRLLTIATSVWVHNTAGAVVCYPMRTDVDIVANFSSSDPFLDEIRTLNRNTFDSNMMSVQSDCTVLFPLQQPTPPSNPIGSDFKLCLHYPFLDDVV
jgi:hypothetical protein